MYSKRITIRLSHKDLMEIKVLAEMSNIQLSSYMRYIIKQQIMRETGRYHHE